MLRMSACTVHVASYHTCFHTSLCPAQVYCITFPAISATRLPCHDQVQLLATSSVLGLAPEAFYKLFPFRESFLPYVIVILLSCKFSRVCPLNEPMHDSPVQ